MGDSSDEEFYSAPGSEEGDQDTCSSKCKVEALEKLSLEEGSTLKEPPQASKGSSHENLSTNEPHSGIKDDLLAVGGVPDSSVDDKGDGESPRQEYASGLDNRFVSDDQEVAEGNKVELSEEQVKELKEKANALKSEGNTHFNNGDYDDAIECYSKALEIYPASECGHEIAICCANRAACHMKLENHQAVIDDCTQTLELEPNYMKAILRRAQASEALEKYEDALTDYKKALEIDPSLTTARQAVLYLPDKIKEQNEKLKEEMLGKLKELGNAILSPFGLSTNNFQLQQNPDTGSYSINFKR